MHRPEHWYRLTSRLALRCAARAVALLLVTAGASAGEMLQPGFYYHEPSTINLTRAVSGDVCIDDAGIEAVCEPAQRITIKGEDICDSSPDQRYPCTRFGFQFNYSDAQPGTYLECTRMRYSPRSDETEDTYQRPIEADNGRIFFSTFRTYAPVEQRVMLSEVHNCSYLGEQVATIEFMIVYEPGVGGPGTGDDAEQRFAEVPNTCSDPYLTEDTARALLRAAGVRRHAATEHIPGLQSQCLYGASGGGKGQVGYVFKFMLSDMLDADKLSQQQLDFNATFANGGAQPEEILTAPGKRAYVFRKGYRATLFVITGIKGRKDVAGRSNEFVATYYIDNPGIDFASKQGALLKQARMHMQHWQQQ